MNSPVVAQTGLKPTGPNPSQGSNNASEAKEGSHRVTPQAVPNTQELQRLVSTQDLSWPSTFATERANDSPEDRERRVKAISDAINTILINLGEDPNREGLLKTPFRNAQALLWFTAGQEKSLKSIINNAIFSEDHDEMVVVKNIDIYSLCEHHMVPFYGKCSIGYIPNKKVLGLSKLARIAEMFARRLQVQERLTRQIANAVDSTLLPRGVAVVIRATHMCMVMRGVQKSGSETITSCMLGAFREDPKTRDEFLSLVKD